MFGFLIKKNFCDVWDNLFHLIIVNLFIIACALVCGLLVVAAGYVPGGTGPRTICQMLAFFVACALLGAVIVAEGDNCAKIANFEGVKISAYFRNILPSLKFGALFGLLLALLATVALVSLPYYFRIWIPSDGSQGSVVGLVLLSVAFWFLVIFLLSVQWLLPVRNLMHNPFLKCLRKSFLIFFDNPGFSIMVALNGLLLLVISVFTLGMIPGVAGLVLANTNALRLRLYKYDWLEVNPGLTKEQQQQVPWDELLATDKKTLGPRKIKSFFFPWKE